MVRDPEIYPTILDGEEARRVVYIAGDIAPTLDGFIITRGNANDAAYDARRGSGNRVISNTVHGEGWSDGSGGLYLSESTATVQSNLIQGNTTDRASGGIDIASCDTPRILDNETRLNTAALIGSGIYARCMSMPRVERNLIVDNAAVFYGGGAMFNNGPWPTFVVNRVFSNTAETGAGLLLGTSGQFTVTNNVVARNGNGGDPDNG